MIRQCWIVGHFEFQGNFILRLSGNLPQLLRSQQSRYEIVLFHHIVSLFRILAVGIFHEGPGPQLRDFGNGEPTKFEQLSDLSTEKTNIIIHNFFSLS